MAARARGEHGGDGELRGRSSCLGPAVLLTKKRKAWDGEEEDEEARSNGWTTLHRAAGARPAQLLGRRAGA